MTTQQLNINLTANDQASAKVRNLASAQKQLGHQTGAVTGFFQKNRRVMQQAGFQVSDFAVQVGAGQSAILAFTQQAPQMLQFFGAFGAIAAGAVAVGGSFALMMIRSGKLTISSADAMKRLTKSVEEVTDSYGKLADAREALIELSTLPMVAAEALTALSTKDTMLAAADLEKAFSDGLIEISKVAEVETKLTGMGAKLQWLAETASMSFTGVSESLNETTDAQRALESQARSLQGTLAEMMTAMGGDDPDRLIAMWLSLNDQASQMGEAGEVILESLVAFRPALDAALKSMRETADEVAEAARNSAEMQRAIQRTRDLYGDVLSVAGSVIGSQRTLVDQAWDWAKATGEVAKNIALAHANKNRPEGSEARAGVSGMSATEALRQKLAGERKESVDSKLDAHKTAMEKLEKAANKAAKSVKKVKIELTKAGEAAHDLADGVGNAIGDGLTAMVDGTESVKDAFRSMAKDVIAQLWDIIVVQRMVAQLSDLITGTFGTSLTGGGPMTAPAVSADGNAFDRNGIVPFARGGVVNSPTMSLMGEAGPEAILPLKRGSNGQLGVQTDGASSSTTVVQHNTINAMNDPSFDRMLAKRMPQLKEMMVGAIHNERQRGAA